MLYNFEQKPKKNYEALTFCIPTNVCLNIERKTFKYSHLGLRLLLQVSYCTKVVITWTSRIKKKLVNLYWELQEFYFYNTFIYIFFRSPSGSHLIWNCAHYPKHLFNSFIFDFDHLNVQGSSERGTLFSQIFISWQGRFFSSDLKYLICFSLLGMFCHNV